MSVSVSVCVCVSVSVCVLVCASVCVSVSVCTGQGGSQSRRARLLTLVFLPFQNLFLGVRVLLLTTCALLTIVSLASLGLGLRSLCRHGIQALAEDESTKKLLGENSVPPSPCKEKTKATIVV
uniref:Transmembrane protein 176B n=1 Tax=Rousettus aegyptiacus TaxID=9407 RepID=A0A7J8D958_ROUAE|nr:transmembrane protein 176B [Rousettus aegyptiacus]